MATNNSNISVSICTLLTAIGMAVSGCKGVPTKSEKQARETLRTSADAFLAYGMLNQPRVRAPYFDYAEAVERITLARSMPDPRLTLEIDIQNVVTTVMPGLMTDLPWTKKLRIRADVASAESEAKLYVFRSAVLQTAFDIKRTFYQLYFLEDRLSINRETLALAGDMEKIARAQMEAGKVTLQDALRAQIEQERLRTEIANLEDSRLPLVARFKTALGMGADQPDPPVPQAPEPGTLPIPPAELYTLAIERNPRLKQMEAEVRMAETGIGLARLSRLPDFNVGMEADAKASPVMWRPTGGMTLPNWRK